jgi:hypothetical protein
MDFENRLKRLEWMNRFLIGLLSAVLIVAWSTASGHVNGASRTSKVVANSVVTHSLTVDNSTGKQAVTVDVGDDGMVSIGMTDVNGKETIGFLVDSAGNPSICLADKGTPCRIVIGDVYRGSQRELNIQLRDKDGTSVWMPPTANPIAAAGHDNSGK